MSELWRRLRVLFRRGRFDRDLEEEMRSHLEMEAEENRADGMGAEEARYAAMRQFGNATRLQETSRELWGWRWLDELAQDIRFTLRMLRKNPGYFAVAMLILALGVGASTALFSIVNAVLFRPLPFPESNRLAVLLTKQQNREGQSIETTSSPYFFVSWRDHARSLEQISAAMCRRRVLIGRSQSRVQTGSASVGFFRLLGLKPILGRTFTREEDEPRKNSVALLDEAFWHRQFGGDPAVLGRSIRLDDKIYDIVGVLPKGLNFADFGPVDIWLPLAAARDFSLYTLVVVGRLKPGVSFQSAQAEMDTVMRATAAEMVQGRYGRPRNSVTVKPLRQWMAGEVRNAFLAVLGAAALLLLLACANLATVQMARATARQRELAVRAALGAGWFRLVWQMVVENTLLAVAGGGLGLLAAVFLVRAVPAIQAFRIPRLDEIGVNWDMFLFAAAVSLAAGILFGLASAVEASRPDLALTLKGGGPVSGIRGQSRLRATLVVTQVALALVLLSGTGLLLNTFLHLLRVDLGFQPHNLLTVELLPPFPLPDRIQMSSIAQQLADRLRSLPGVQETSTCDNLPVQAVLAPFKVRAAGEPRREWYDVMAREVAPKYFEVTGIRIKKGRGFEPGDDKRNPVPIVVSESVARLLFGSENPLGGLLVPGMLPRAPKALEIIGVAGEARQLGLREEPALQVYLPFIVGSPWYVIARTTSRPSLLAGLIRTAVRDIAPNYPVPEISTMEERLAEQVATPKFYLLLLGAFAIAGLALAVLGVYGVLSYSVARRSHEIGVRMALGAERASILRMVVGQGLLMTLLGAVLGLAGALASMSLLVKLLYGVRPNDPATLVCASLLLVAVAFAASYIPARRAARIDPMEALRHE